MTAPLGPHPHGIHVVGVGASAGGLEALERFFDNVPKDAEMAFVVIQHLSPDFKSLMDELLARHTSLPIHLVEDGMLVEKGHVYLIPPKKEMVIAGGRLHLTERDRQQELTLPVDIFFRSLAKDCGPRGVAVVLSGGGSDGSRGVRDVYEAGGLVLVQDGESAQFDGMPRSARETGVAHWILPPQDMAPVIVDHTTMRAGERQDGPRSTTAAAAHGLPAVYQMLQEEYGIDFTHYKPSTITRRIERRILLARSQDIEEYVQRLKGDAEELDVLYRDLLIGVTRFFRDPEAFKLLEEKILPELLQRTPRDAPIRIWVAGCATGEEPYSIAIVMQELMRKLGERPVKIFATDVHRGSLERAARAVYDEETLANVSRERLERYFLRTGSSYQVVADIRQMVVFAAQDVTKDPPFTRVDLVSCRNMLIYLQPPTQQKVLSLFHFALQRDGILLLGPSETVGNLASVFEVVDKHWQVYRKHSDARIPIDARLQSPTHSDLRTLQAGTPPPRYSLAQLLGTYDALLDDVMPPSLLVSDRGELVHSFAGASKFLRIRDGRQGLDVLDVVDTELKMVLVGGLKRALNDPNAIVFKGVRIGEGEGQAVHTVTIRRIRGRNGGPPHLLVTIEAVEGPSRETSRSTEIDLDQVSRQQLATLESELSYTKENLQAAIEELEASNEELQASNEELQASNEELQSTNEELQSVNEELYTVNAEYQRKIGELTEVTNDMDNLLSSTQVGTIFLDRDLMIRKFTPQIADTFKLVPHDVGRSLETFASRLDHPELLDDLRTVLANATPVERELRDARGRAFFMRTLPYRARGGIDGVVLTLIDVTGLKAAEDALFHERYLLNSLLSSVPDTIYFKDAAGRFIRANEPMARRLGAKDEREVVGKTVRELASPADPIVATQHEDDDVIATGEPQHYRQEKHKRPDGGDGWNLVTRMPLRDANNRIVGVIGISRDVTEMKNAEERIQEGVRRRDQFLAMLSHELRNPLGAIVSATALLKAEGMTPSKATRPIDVLERQSGQMTRLLDDLLEVSRVTQNKIELKKRVVDLRVVVREAAEALRTQFDSRAIDLTLKIDGPPILVDGDAARLQQIQANLLSNAAKYTPRNGHVVLELSRDGDKAVVRVTDDGAGIPRDMLSSVFDLFVQSTRTLDRAAGGLGVGLTLVRSLVEMHGGTVDARSDGEGRGSEFIVRLPIAAQSTVQAMDAVAPTAQSTGHRMPHRASVVLVEDNRDSREMLCEFLAANGFECHSAQTGTEGLEMIDALEPHIAIVDVGLPVMDGFELARRVRQNPKHAHLFLIALTGYGQSSDRAASREAGFDEHLVKPASIDHLLAILNARRESDTARPHIASLLS